MSERIFYANIGALGLTVAWLGYVTFADISVGRVGVSLVCWAIVSAIVTTAWGYLFGEGHE